MTDRIIESSSNRIVIETEIKREILRMRMKRIKNEWLSLKKIDNMIFVKRLTGTIR